MIYFFLLMASTFRLMGCVETPIIHDFLDAVGFFFRPRRPPPWGWCGLSFSFFDPHGLPLFFADPVDFTISTSWGQAVKIWYNTHYMKDLKAAYRTIEADHFAPRMEVSFIDGDKREYPAYYNMLMEGGYVRSGSFMLADNILWYGKVAEPIAHNDKHTEAIVEFNRMVCADERVDNVIVPIRDGINLIRVK